MLLNSGTPPVFSLFLLYLGNRFLITLALSMLEYILKYAIQPHHTSEEIVFFIEMLSTSYLDLRKEVARSRQSQHPGAARTTL